MRTEEALVGESLELLELRPGGLRFRGELVAVHWDDQQGSIGQFLVRAGFSRLELEGKLERVRFFVEHGVPEQIGLWDAVEALMTLFPAGPYLLRYPYESDEGGFVLVEWEDEGFYPCGGTVLATRPSAQLDPARIDHWRERLREGARPMLILGGIEGTSYHFLLDGHHKVKAYQAEDLQPPLFAIDAREVHDPLTPDEWKAEREAFLERSKKL